MNGIGGGRWLTYFGLAGAASRLDWAKEKLFAELGPRALRRADNIESIRWIWPGLFGLQTSLNEGALFGMGQGKVWIFATLSIAAAVAIFVWLFFRKAAQDRILLVALSGISGASSATYTTGLASGGRPSCGLSATRRARLGFSSASKAGPGRTSTSPTMLLVGGAGLLILHVMADARRRTGEVGCSVADEYGRQIVRGSLRTFFSPRDGTLSDRGKRSARSRDNPLRRAS